MAKPSPLPAFKYHPNPVATGMIVEKSARCPCCERTTGFAYAVIPYGEKEVPDLCPWCIADGSAAAKFEVTFSDDEPLRQAGLSEAIVSEVVQRTPGYISWQQDCWLCCCDDACEYHGDLSREEFDRLVPDAIARFQTDHEMDAEGWTDLQRDYDPDESPVIYKFLCRHCRQLRLGFDFA